jgi:glycosyltransferase involved in cell wall biosynthesis
MSQKNILIIDSAGSSLPLLPLFKELANNSFKFYLRTGNNMVAAVATTNQWATKKIVNFSSIFLNKNTTTLLVLLLPGLYLYTSFVLLLAKTKDKTNIILCCNCYEKIIFTPLAKLLRIKIVWYEFPTEQILPNLTNRLLQRAARSATLVVPFNFIRQKLLQQNCQEKNITLIRPGTDLNNYRRQENIFSEIAAGGNRWPQRKFFTIGTVADTDNRKNIETLFSAAIKFLDVIHFPQIIVIDELSERKSLAWTAKKMKIDNLVWFVSEQNYAKKWFENFDIFIITNRYFTLANFNIFVRAAAAGLPIIAPDNSGWEEVITDGVNGFLVSNNDSEKLAQMIIKLQQNKELRALFGNRTKQLINEQYNGNNAIKKFSTLFNS